MKPNVRRISTRGCRSGRLLTMAPACLVLGVLCLAGAPGAAQEDRGAREDRQLEQLLDRLGLVDLQALHLEQRLDEEDLSEQDRLETARRLADLYAGQLVDASNDRAKYEQTMQRIGRLTEKVPQAKTPSLEVMLLQADYTRADQLTMRWMTDRAKSELRREAAEIFDRIAPQLHNQQERLSSEVERLAEQLEAVEDEAEQEAKSNELSRLEQVSARAGFFAGWSSYYRALVSDGTASSDGYDKARQMFRKLLDITSDYSELEPEMLGLELPMRCRALIGLALAEAGAGNRQDSETCFAWLEHASVPGEILDQLPYWRLQALLNSDRHAEALEYAEEQVASFSSSPTAGKQGFCQSLVHAGFGGEVTQTLRRLGMQGIIGLVKIGHYEKARGLVGQYDIEPDEESGFYLRWIKAQQLYDEALEAGSQEAYVRAAKALEAALEDPQAQDDLRAAAQCRLKLASSRYRMGQLEAAARQFEQAENGLKATGDAEAIKSAWMAFVAYHKLSEEKPGFLSSAIEVLERIKRDYSGEELARRAEYQLIQLRQKTSAPADRLADLESVEPGSPNYLAARHAICSELYQQCSDSEGQEQQAVLRRLAKAVDTYLRAARGEESPKRQVKCCLLAVKAAMKSDPPELEMAALYLDKARPLADRLDRSESVAAEFHYHALRLAQQTGEDSAADEHVQWLMDHGQGSQYELTALAVAAREIQAELESAEGEEKGELHKKAYRIYQRMAQALGDSPSDIGSNNHSRTAVSRLAQYASLLGRHEEAAELLDRLLAAQPKEQSYLRRAGLAHYRAGNYEKSIHSWRTLRNGLPKASEPWFEAKYYQLKCLSHLDPDQFRKAWQQFELLYPKLGPPKWRDRLAELGEE